jgi:hypothetical protein
MLHASPGSCSATREPWIRTTPVVKHLGRSFPGRGGRSSTSWVWVMCQVYTPWHVIWYPLPCGAGHLAPHIPSISAPLELCFMWGLDQLPTQHSSGTLTVPELWSITGSGISGGKYAGNTGTGGDAPPPGANLLRSSWNRSLTGTWAPITSNLLWETTWIRTTSCPDATGCYGPGCYRI